MTNRTELGEMTHVRIHQAPRQLVFDCLTKPEHLTHLWGPTGVSTPIDGIVVDLRPGGAFETLMINDDNGEEYPMKAVFVEIDPPAKLVWTEPDVEGGMTSTVTLVDLGDGRTEVTVHQTNVPAMYLTPENQAGFASSLDKGVAYTAKLAAA